MSAARIIPSIDPATWIPTTQVAGSGMHWPRGFRAGNPGNIDYHRNQPWQGLADPPIEDRPLNGARPRFCRFTSAVWGLRAIFRVLITYRDRVAIDGTPVDTIDEIIARWAPAVENNVIAYVNAVDQAHPAGRHDVLDVRYYEDAMPLAKAIVRHELGNPAAYGLAEWYPQHVWDRAADLAGLKRRAPKRLATDPAVVAPAVAGAALSVEQLAPYVPVVKDLVEPGSATAHLIALLAVAALAVIVLNRLRKRRVEAS